MIGEYRQTIEDLLQSLTEANHGLAAEIASVPEHIRGFGHVKDRNIVEADARLDRLLAAYRSGKSSAGGQIAAE